MISLEDLNEGISRLVGKPYFTYEREVVGAGGYYLAGDVDGIISVVAFGCGPDSMMIELVTRAARREFNKPLMSITIDEHTAEAGLVTRLEAFVDMLQRRLARQEAGRRLVLGAYLGIDVGSVTTKVAVLTRDDRSDRQRLRQDRGQTDSGGSEGPASRWRRSCPPGLRWRAWAPPGSGRYLAGAMLGADVVKNEITAHAVAASHYFPRPGPFSRSAARTPRSSSCGTASWWTSP